jgi:hypothetical protein
MTTLPWSNSPSTQPRIRGSNWALQALVVRNLVNFLHRQPMPPITIPSTAQDEGDRFLAVTREKEIL